MKRLPTALALIAFAASAALADDKDKLDGKWTAKAGPSSNVPLTLAFDKAKQTVEISFTTPMGDEKKIAGKFKIDETAKPYPTMTWTEMKIDDRVLPDNKAIYQLSDGDKTLKVAGALPKARCPASSSRRRPIPTTTRSPTPWSSRG